MIVAVYIAGFLLAVLGGAFFAGMETAVVGLKASRVSKMRRQGGPLSSQAKTLIRVLANKDSFLGGTLIGGLVCNVLAVVFAVAALEPWFANRWSAALVAAAIVSIDFVLFGLLVPKYVFRQHPLELSLMLAPLMQVTLTVFAPFSWSFGRISSALVWLAGKASPPKFSFVSREELKFLAPRPKTKSGLNTEATQMIHKIFDLRQTLIRDVMVPLEKASTVAADASPEEVLETARSTGFSRLLVVQSEAAGATGRAQVQAGAAATPSKQTLPAPILRGRVLGVVSVYDILYGAGSVDPHADAPKTASHFLRRAATLADTDPIDRALQHLRAARLPMAIVTNAQKDAVGIITVDDIVGRIVAGVA